MVEEYDDFIKSKIEQLMRSINQSQVQNKTMHPEACRANLDATFESTLERTTN